MISNVSQCLGNQSDHNFNLQIIFSYFLIFLKFTCVLCGRYWFARNASNAFNFGDVNSAKSQSSSYFTFCFVLFFDYLFLSLFRSRFSFCTAPNLFILFCFAFSLHKIHIKKYVRVHSTNLETIERNKHQKSKNKKIKIIIFSSGNREQRRQRTLQHLFALCRKIEVLIARQRTRQNWTEKKFVCSIQRARGSTHTHTQTQTYS